MKPLLPDFHCRLCEWIKSLFPILLVLLVPGFHCPTVAQTKTFEPAEATIADIHRALRSGKLTCRQLVAAYLKRIEAYDQPTKLNAIVIVNPQALAEADKLDAEFKRTKKLRPLHGIPVIVKDNFDTKDLQTTGGSIALKGSLPPDDAFQVRRIREAGAIVLAKSNMDEWAFRPVVTESSTAGITRNPYDLERVPAGSSGGTAAAVAASFGAVGLGSDTGNSIRGPASHNALVGIRATMGLTSRDGIIPLFLRQDVGGPLARTVEDAVRMLEVIAGYDPADPITKESVGKAPKSYTQFLKRDGLKGARLGVFRRYLDTPTTDPQIKKVMTKAIADLKAQGAIIVDPFDLPSYPELTRNISCNSFHYDLNNYLASLGEKAKYKTLAAIVAAGLYLPVNETRLKNYVQTPAPAANPCQDVYHDPRSIALREAILAAMENDKLDAIIYPTWSNAPRKVGDMQSPAGDNSQILSPQTGFPAITVPMGFTNGSLPAGITFLGRLFSEPDLIRVAYAYEQATKQRRPPVLFPPLP
ncbi:MAG: amidase [Acidobacteria bacterium]|nr:amidase [Acidobacteriota bacterium]MBI3425404.1 amidase [Acidobacteriota bacterium]